MELSERMEKQHPLGSLVRVARRENNTKRSYLYVNPLQGKHVPVSPSVSQSLFGELARKLEEQFGAERLLVIGFAETATAIGLTAAMEAGNVRFCMTTTRENVPDTDYLFFTESHSHATEQRLAVRGLGEALQETDRVVFAEDEVTTGNTIMKLVSALQRAFPEYRGGFAIASILNSMQDARMTQLGEQGIPCLCLQRIPAEYRVQDISGIDFLPLETDTVKEGPGADVCDIQGLWNPRTVCRKEDAASRCRSFLEQMLARISLTGKEKRILVLGTEECMYPGMCLGAALEQRNPDLTVRYHATTRSPIDISLAEGYPLFQRTPLDSLYEAGRKTFLYNLDCYDRVFVVTDTPAVNPAGAAGLVHALRQYGNTDITFFRWCP